MSNYNNLVKKLKEIFQIDQADLDFGIYRILRTRSAEITKYLDETLKKKVEESLKAAALGDVSALKKELDEAIKGAQSLGVNPQSVPKVLDLQTKISAMSKAGTDYSDQVFAHLTTFFSRYYDKGDFLSRRRYKGDTYAVPYNGEEVVLHWANKDQYYIKSGEQFSNFTFSVPLEEGKEGRVHFKLLAAQTSKDNRKDSEVDRRFVLATDYRQVQVDEEGEEFEQSIPLVEERNGELFIHFLYQPVEKTKQADLNKAALETLKAQELLKSTWKPLWKLLPTESNPGRTLLEKQLSTYTEKNTSDYFIHKNLGDFLRRELDFYIKNEVMNLDDIQNIATFQNIEHRLRMIQVLRSIALDLIDFLAQLENFQKKLWLKKKFVVDAQYCLTLDKIDAKHYPSIAGNKRQVEEWVKLGFLETPTATVETLKEKRYMLVDTGFFPQDFKYTLLAHLYNIDEEMDGVLINSENFQALNILQERYREQVKCVYIDPPYNTGSDDNFSYKDNYQHSTWATMVFDRVKLGSRLLNNKAFFWGHIDYNEAWTFKSVLDNLFGTDRFVNEIIWKRRGGSSNPSNQLGVITDTIYLYRSSTESILNPLFTKDSEEAKNYILERFVEKEENGRLYMKSPIVSPNYRENLCYNYKGYKHPPNGWSINIELMEKWDKENKLYFPKRGERIYRKIFLDEYPGQPIQNLWLDIFVINPMANERVDFSTQKPLSLLKRVLQFSTFKDSIALDYFAGSGTTGHAVINLNREDDGKRKYILVEMGEYFDTILKPRIQKAVYNTDWKEGGPQAPKAGVSHAFKYFKMESYEDTLNNLELNRPVEDLFSGLQDKDKKAAQEDYLLRYMLDFESRHLLSTDLFRKPFDFQLNIAKDSSGAYEPVRIDLVETFNYLIGLKVHHLEANLDKGFLMVEGETLAGEKTLVYWRDCDKIGYEELPKYSKHHFDPTKSEFDVIYLNGDHNFPNQVVTEEGVESRTLKLRSLEDEFLTRMFDVQDVL